MPLSKIGEDPWRRHNYTSHSTCGGDVLTSVEIDRGCFACMLGGENRRTLFIVVAEWPDAMRGGTRTGQVLTVEAPAPGTGWP